MSKNAEIDTAEIDTTEIMSSGRWKQTEKVGKLIRNKRRDADPPGRQISRDEYWTTLISRNISIRNEHIATE